MKSKKLATPQDTSNLYLFYGDEFLVKEQVYSLIDNILDPGLRNTNLMIFDGGNLDISALSSHLFTPSLFGGSRVLLVDQTTIFMGRSDHGKVMNKSLDCWRAGDRNGALRAFGRLLSVSGVSTRDLTGNEDWITEISESVALEDRETLARIAEAFLEDGKTAVSGGEDFLEELINSTFPEGTVLVFSATSVDKKKKVFKALDKRGRIVECAVRQEKYGAGLDRDFFAGRVKETLQAAGKNISPAALNKMYARSGSEMRTLQSELDKLIGYVGTRAGITEADVDALFSDFHQAAFFELNNVLRTCDISKCLPALHENLKIVAHPLQTLGAIATEFRRLMIAREMLFTVFKSSWKPGMQYKGFVSVVQQVREDNPGLMGKGKFRLLSMKDYPLYLYLKDAQKFPMIKLMAIMEKILQVDIQLKSSRLGSKAPKTLLEDLVLTICGSFGNKARG
jgi:DNA polymerase III subunit delta